MVGSPSATPKTIRHVVAMLGLLAAVSAAPFGAAFAYPIAITNANFATPGVCGDGHTYQFTGAPNCANGYTANLNAMPGIGWTFADPGPTLSVSGPLNGIVAPWSGFGPPSFVGMPFGQAAFLQSGFGNVSQSLGGFVAGDQYTLSFYLGSRTNYGLTGGVQTIRVLIDNVVIGTINTPNAMPWTLQNIAFSVAAGGAHTLSFASTIVGDSSAFFSGVSINGASVPAPASLALLAIGLLGFGGSRRAAKTAA